MNDVNIRWNKRGEKVSGHKTKAALEKNNILCSSLSLPVPPIPSFSLSLSLYLCCSFNNCCHTAGKSVREINKFWNILTPRVLMTHGQICFSWGWGRG